MRPKNMAPMMSTRPIVERLPVTPVDRPTVATALTVSKSRSRKRQSPPQGPLPTSVQLSSSVIAEAAEKAS